jgi:hypothetical protein
VAQTAKFNSRIMSCHCGALVNGDKFSGRVFGSFRT